MDQEKKKLAEGSKIKVSKRDRKRRSERMIQMNKERAAEKREQAEVDALAMKNDMPPKHKQFADLYIWGDKKIQGNPAKCYMEIFDCNTPSTAGHSARKLLKMDHMVDYINKQMEEFELLLKVEKFKNIQTLTAIRDEMSEAEYVNRFGEINGVPACRNVAIKASEVINDMIGASKPKEINVNHGSQEGGVVFNLVVPEPPRQVDSAIDIDHEEI